MYAPSLIFTGNPCIIKVGALEDKHSPLKIQHELQNHQGTSFCTDLPGFFVFRADCLFKEARLDHQDDFVQKLHLIPKKLGNLLRLEDESLSLGCKRNLGIFLASGGGKTKNNSERPDRMSKHC